MKTIKEMSNDELVEMFTAGQTIIKQSALFGVPAFTTNKVKGMVCKEVGDMYVSACKEIMIREDKSLFVLQGLILDTLIKNI